MSARTENSARSTTTSDSASTVSGIQGDGAHRRRRSRILAIVASCLLLAVAVARLPIGQAQAADADPRYGDQVTRLYRTILGRNPDIGGHDYWTERLLRGESVITIARGFLSSPEAAQKSSGDPIRDAYVWALGREPDAAGYAHWVEVGVVESVVAISDSPEHRATTGTLPPPPINVPLAGAASIPQGWVDTGNGVYVPPILLKIRWCESHDDYTAANPRSSARGGYQFLRSSWHSYGHAAEYGVDQAHYATPAEQDMAALKTWEISGTSPWLASAACWR